MATGAEAVEFFRRIFEEIVFLDPDLTTMGKRAGAPFGALGMLLHLGIDSLIGRDIFQYHFQGVQHGHAAGCLAIEVAAYFEF